MEFKKLRKGILKKGIKGALFSLLLSVMALSFITFKSGDEAYASGFTVNDDQTVLTLNGHNYTWSNDNKLTNDINCKGLEVNVFEDLSDDDYAIMWVKGNYIDTASAVATWLSGLSYPTGRSK